MRIMGTPLAMLTPRQCVHISKTIKLEALTSSECHTWMDAIRQEISAAQGDDGQTHDLKKAGDMKCQECRKYVDMESFALGDHVGYLTKRGGGKFPNQSHNMTTSYAFIALYNTMIYVYCAVVLTE